MLTGLALAGRVGANIAAELGTMHVTEQIDALETLGYHPLAYLVVPRALSITFLSDSTLGGTFVTRDERGKIVRRGKWNAARTDLPIRARP